VDLSPLVTHRFKLDDIEAAYELFAHQRDGVMKVAITLNKGLFRFDGGFSMNIDISATAAPHGWWCRWTMSRVLHQLQERRLCQRLRARIDAPHPWPTQRTPSAAGPRRRSRAAEAVGRGKAG
jgi:hypothetical protein